MPENKQAILDSAYNGLGRPYLLGAKWALGDSEPTGPVDCSGFIRWCYHQGGLVIPDGSKFQYRATEPVEGEPIPTDLAFFIREGVTHHVGMLFDKDWVIEARGNPYNKVIRRPRKKWEAFNEFSGWRRL